MTEQVQNNQAQSQEAKQNEKEVNFRALEAKYQRQIEQERAGRLEAERIAQEAIQRHSKGEDDEDDDSEPYVDNKKLNKKLAKFGENTKKQTQTDIHQAVQVALHEERKKTWMKNNPDFYDVLNHADKIIQKDPELAETILEMPEGFERQKLVYKSIKAMGLDKPEVKQQSIQEKVDANKRSPYYMPTGVGTAPYSTVGNFSESGQKEAYQKMQDLKKRMRLG
jgi:hypothetical protein